jgi:acetylornithine deacetylase/succinyl-diaminopimelate desuccinylase-like protein
MQRPPPLAAQAALLAALAATSPAQRGRIRWVSTFEGQTRTRDMVDLIENHWEIGEKNKKLKC